MSPSTESYDPHYFEPLFAAEERHFWFVARNKVICALSRKAVSGIVDPHLLEVGCGTGNVLQALEKNLPQTQIFGIDLFHEGLSFARRRVKSSLIQADLASPPVKSTFDLVGLFDVLEHIKEDTSALRQIFRLVKPGGSLLLTVPADPRLWSYFDLASHHVRRYTADELREKVTEAGFDVEFLSPYITITHPFLWLGRKTIEKTISFQESEIQKSAEKEFKIIPIINEIICGLLSFEAGWLEKGRTLPFGSSLVMTARRPVTSL